LHSFSFLSLSSSRSGDSDQESSTSSSSESSYSPPPKKILLPLILPTRCGYKYLCQSTRAGLQPWRLFMSF
jgi:hypothetical protein